MSFKSILYFKDTGEEHVCSNLIDEKEILATGCYFKNKEDAIATEAEIVEEQKPVEVKKTTARKASK